MENIDGLLSSALVAMDKIHPHSCTPVSVAVVHVGTTWIGCQPLGGEHPQVHQWIELSSMMRAAGIQSAQAGPCAVYIGLAVFVDDADHCWCAMGMSLNPRENKRKTLTVKGETVMPSDSESKAEKRWLSGTQKVVMRVDDEGVGVSSAGGEGGGVGRGLLTVLQLARASRQWVTGHERECRRLLVQMVGSDGQGTEQRV
ncbi:hypothetical protein F5148DRAFT_1149814 [Russula earlei]|uniref:Uncharacterized protein n=1 Tax=Russula earlei TaxID=71964 RepID=A0ACC0U6X6_9AGAM|nr:hypothetical protein F5148DRAFT_1149814 [Russula earlei]